MISIIQGDSFGQDITCTDSSVTYDVNWVGKWALVPTVGAVAAISGDLTKSVDNKTFYLRIPPASTAGLTPGRYVLCVQVENSVTVFKAEIQQEEFIIKKQGIPN